jgi:hypothetical protein
VDSVDAYAVVTVENAISFPFVSTSFFVTLFLEPAICLQPRLSPTANEVIVAKFQVAGDSRLDRC